MSKPKAPPLSDVIENVGFGWGQFKALLNGGGVWMADGAELLIIGSVTRAVSEEWMLSAWQRGTVVSVVFIGVLIGNLLSGRLGDSIGRRKPIVLSYALILIFSVISVLAWNYWSLIAIRFLVGIAFGIGQPAWNAVGGEICPANRRIHMTALGQVLFTAGEFYSAGLIFYDDPEMEHLDWRWLILMGGVPSGIFCISSYFYLIESPSFLAIKGRSDEAREMLISLRDDNGKNDVSVDFTPPAIVVETSDSHKYGVVFGSKLLFSTIVTCMSTLTANVLFYGGLYAFPQVLPDIELAVSPALNLMIGAAWEVPGYALGVVLGMKYSRRSSILGYLVAVMISTLLFAAGASEVLKLGHDVAVPFHLEVMVQLGLYGNKIFTSVGFLLIYLYSIEIYPTSCRATGTSVCISAGRVGAILCPVVYELMTLKWGEISFFYFMAVLCVVNAALVFNLRKETHGAKLEDHEETDPLVINH